MIDEQEVQRLQAEWQALRESGHMTIGAIRDLVIPFRDRHGLSDLQVLQLARNEITVADLE